MRLLFRAVYKDGEIYDQDQSDKSRLHDWGTCFTDVEHEKLHLFILRDAEANEGLGADLYVVHCETGEIMVNGFAFDLFDRNLDISKVDLIYERTREVQQTINADTKEELGTTDRIVRYILGVKLTDVDGNEVKRVIYINE